MDDRSVKMMLEIQVALLDRVLGELSSTDVETHRRGIKRLEDFRQLVQDVCRDIE